MADVAEALGVAKGTVYGYVESKEALFDAAVRYADQRLAEAPAHLPVRTPAPGETASYVRERLALEAAEMTLVRVSSGTLVIRDTVEELTSVLRDLYRSILRNRLALKL